MSLGGREGGTSAALYLIEGSTLREAGAINGIATLDASGTLTPDQVPASIANGLTFQAEWNAATNTPTLPPVSTPDPGDYWIVTTAGSTALPGAAGPWTVGQVAVFNGVDWDALSMYPLAVGLPVAGASAGDVLYVNGSAVLAYAAPGTTSGVQAYSAALAAISTNGTPTAWGLARLLDANQSANQTALGLGTIATQASNNVSITGGAISGISALEATTIEIGHASDTTLSRAAAGVLAVEGVRIQPVSSASAPTVNDDAGDGYAVGQMWVNTTTKVPYVLVDSTLGAAVWRSLLNADAVEIRLESGAWVWASQAWNGSAWVDVSASTALTVETSNASITFSGTTLNLASGLTDGGTSPHGAQSKVYVALADLPIWSSTTGAIYRVESSQTSMGTGSRYARWGWALATPTGSYDANTETHSAMRGGFDGPNWIFRYAVGTGTFSSGYSNATIPSVAQLWWTPGLAGGAGFYYYSSATSTGGALTVPTAVPTRIYAIAMAGGGTLTANVAVVDPRIRIIRLPGSP